tara:strand:- start:969 stop:1532 length:564 start_codon:yes stop_codon:yes gene_type:complete
VEIKKDNKLKYAITGHTNGIGKAFSELSEIKNNFIGFSKSNGYNIKDVEDRRKIIRESIDCDVFINNAYTLYYQTDLLYELHKKWKDKDKIIINMGSNTTDGMKDFPHTYTAHKASLETASLQLSNTKDVCRVALLKFGYVGTERILKYMKPKNYIPVEEAAKIIYQTVEWANKYNVRTMTILPREQ